jgi:hypothetical protein
MAYSFGGKIATDGLVRYWDVANKLSYSATETDTSVKTLALSNNNTLNPAILQNIEFSDQTYNADGGGSFLIGGVSNVFGAVGYPIDNAYSYLLALDQTYAVSIWIKIDVFVAANQLIFTSDGSGLPMNIAIKYIETDDWRFSGTLVGSYEELFSNEPIEANRWYNVTVTATANSTPYFKLYINGHLNSSDSDYSPNIAEIRSPFTVSYIGGEAMVSAISIYDQELSDDQVLQNYNALKYRFGL